MYLNLRPGLVRMIWYGTVKMAALTPRCCLFWLVSVLAPLTKTEECEGLVLAVNGSLL